MRVGDEMKAFDCLLHVVKCLLWAQSLFWQVIVFGFLHVSGVGLGYDRNQMLFYGRLPI